MASPPVVRVFVAIAIPDDVRARLDAALEIIRPTLPQVRWVRADLWHLTLVFLGERPWDLLPAISDVVAGAGAGVAPFTLGLSGIGAFPNQNRPRVLWTGVQPGTEPLHTLQRSMLAGLVRSGITQLDERFSAHLTVGRVRDDCSPAARADVGRRWAGTTIPPLPQFRVDDVHIVQSQLSPKGPTYTTLQTVPLKGSPTAV
jgi:2'-5' RNA ligase